MAGPQFHHEQAVTEYDRNYKPFRFIPQPLAGKESFKMYITQEPPLQRKRRIDPPGHEQDENYLLVGQSTEKFAPAMLYRDKNPLREKTLPNKQTKRHRSMERAENARSKGRNGFSGKEDLSLKLTPDSQDRNGVAQDIERSKQKRKSEKAQKKSRAASRNRQRPDGHSQMKNAPLNSEEGLKAKSRSEERPHPSLEDHGQHPRATVARQSEYQGNYSLKSNQLTKLYRQTPILKTEDIFYRSHLNAPKNVPMPWKTEYRQNFKPYRFITEEDYKRRQSILDKHHVDNPPLDERIRPVIVALDNRRARTPSPERKGIQKIEINGNTFTAENMLNPQRIGFPLGPRRMTSSEYQSNYKNFWKALLDSQKGGEMKKKSTAGGVSKSFDASASGDETSWLQELQELRRRAEEHKKRARGSHFSREHMAQLLSHENKYWDVPSTTRSNIQDPTEGDNVRAPEEPLARESSSHENSVQLSLGGYESEDESTATVEEPEVPKFIPKKTKTPNEHPARPNTASGKPLGNSRGKKSSIISSRSSFSDVHEEKVYDDRKYRSGSQCSTSDANSIAKTKSKASHIFHSTNANRRGKTPSPVRIPVDNNGRLATPKMPDGKYQRHHADRTTPNIGGAILTAPKTVPEFNEETSKTVQENNSIVSSKKNMAPAGRPTLDTHVLVDEPLYSTGLVTKTDVDEGSDDQITSVSSLSQRHYNDSFAISNGRPQQVGYVFTGTSTMRPPSAVSNELSMSVRSNASSCGSSSTHNLALQTLERAKKRKEEFWGK